MSQPEQPLPDLRWQGRADVPGFGMERRQIVVYADAVDEETAKDSMEFQVRMQYPSGWSYVFDVRRAE